ncbi:MAG: NUDIX domain-containing protein [Candidatus Micrarchaeota archaeon]|nr:NUDIX domain-containing protein [Candidatus Micrarchaeota archaeon]
MEKKCLVVKNEYIFGKEGERVFYGFKHIGDINIDIEKLIREHGEYKERYGEHGMESNPNYQQIIPYILFRHKGRFFMYERLGGGGEKRLYNLKSLGIGGHIDPGDFGDQTLAQALRREFFEEVAYAGRFEPKMVGLINEKGAGDGKDVQDVHLGVVFLVDGDSDSIDIAPEEKNSNKKVGLFSVEELAGFYSQMEGWSKIVYDNFIRKT